MADGDREVAPRKLIEVAIPLQAINVASAREKSIRHGHPSTLHLWWARRPLAACRAVLFAQLVDDPSAHPDQFPTPKAQASERQRLFRIIEQLVEWKNSDNKPGSSPALAPLSARCAGGHHLATGRGSGIDACGLQPARAAPNRPSYSGGVGCAEGTWSQAWTAPSPARPNPLSGSCRSPHRAHPSFNRRATQPRRDTYRHRWKLVRVIRPACP